MGRPVIDMTGQKFGKMTITGDSGRRQASGNVVWSCMCDCGSTSEATTHALRSGSTVSCGCHRKGRLRTHGERGSKLHYVWCAMRQRCNNQKNKDYKYYGALGVRVCAEWDNFLVFKAWCLANGYAEGLTIDRRDTFGIYEPDNCRFITIQEQQLNKRNCKIYKDHPKQVATAYEAFQ